jgi:hypothetical protein
LKFLRLTNKYSFLLNNFYQKENFFESNKYEYSKKKNKLFLIKKKHNKMISKINLSTSREINFTPTQKLLNVIFRNGDKINTLKNVNIFLENFFSDFDALDNSLILYKNYKLFFKLLEKKKSFYNFNELLIVLAKFYQFVFDFKTNKIKKNLKKSKKSIKNTHSFFYVKQNKRFKHTLKMIYHYSSKFQEENFHKRIYLSFFHNLLNKNESDLFKKRTFIYINIIKQFSKKK